MKQSKKHSNRNRNETATLRLPRALPNKVMCMNSFSIWIRISYSLNTFGMVQSQKWARAANKQTVVMHGENGNTVNRTTLALSVNKHPGRVGVRLKCKLETDPLKFVYSNCFALNRMAKNSSTTAKSSTKRSGNLEGRTTNFKTTTPKWKKHQYKSVKRTHETFVVRCWNAS